MAEVQSPGGFVFGVQGWSYGEQRPTCITWFIDGTVKVSDQHGRPIDEFGVMKSHAEAVARLVQWFEGTRIKWFELPSAGWPQLPYAELKKLPSVPPTPIEELRKIKDQALRKDALRLRREMDDVRAKEMQAAESE